MEKVDAHLEASLAEMNDKVASMEESGDARGLMEAYVNRGSVLAMMEYRTAAAEDFEEAAAIADGIGDADAGTFVKIHVSLAMLEEERGGDPCAEYEKASERLPGLGDGSLHYDARSAARLCATACRSLLDYASPGSCGPYVENGLRLASGSDPWSAYRRLELLLLGAEAAEDMEDPETSLEFCDAAVEVACALAESEELEDAESMVLALVMRASAEGDLSMDEEAIDDLSAAVDVLEGLMAERGLEDKDSLISLHHDLAGALMKAGRVEEAERHLVRAMEIGVGVAVGFEVHGPQGDRG